MPPRKLESIRLRYGSGNAVACDVDPSRLLAVHTAPAAIADLEQDVAETLAAPLEFPPLRRCVFSGDRVVLAVDRDIPGVETILAGMWRQMELANVRPEDVHILQPADRDELKPADPRGELPADVRDAVSWRVHTFERDDDCGYLASSATGDRVYLSRDVLDADVVISVGQIAFDAVLGFRGTNSVFYPGLSNAQAAGRSQGLGHRELGPEDERPLRSLIDEIGWLLGTQFTVQTLPGANGGVSRVTAGGCEAVLRQGKRLLNDHWRVRLSTRSDVVVASVDGLAAGDGWHKLGAAVEAARNLVVRDGRIVILSDFSAELGEGMQLVRDSLEPADALQPLRSIAPSDLLPASQIASAAGWAGIYLLSGLDSDTVEELFMTPLAGHREVQRLLDGEGSCVLLESAHFLATDVAG